jgi:hypothetical protein
MGRSYFEVASFTEQPYRACNATSHINPIKVKVVWLYQAKYLNLVLSAPLCFLRRDLQNKITLGYVYVDDILKKHFSQDGVF